jgi:hypothetical protein
MTTLIIITAAVLITLSAIVLRLCFHAYNQNRQAARREAMLTRAIEKAFINASRRAKINQ